MNELAKIMVMKNQTKTRSVTVNESLRIKWKLKY